MTRSLDVQKAEIWLYLLAAVAIIAGCRSTEPYSKQLPPAPDPIPTPTATVSVTIYFQPGIEPPHRQLPRTRPAS